MQAYNQSFSSSNNHREYEMYLSTVKAAEVMVGDTVYIVQHPVSFSKKRIINIQWSQDYITQTWFADIEFENLDNQSIIPNRLEEGNGLLRDIDNNMYTMYASTSEMETKYGIYRKANLLVSSFITTPDNVVYKDFIVEDDLPNYVRDITYSNGNYIFTYNTRLESEYEPTALIQVIRFEDL